MSQPNDSSAITVGKYNLNIPKLADRKIKPAAVKPVNSSGINIADIQAEAEKLTAGLEPENEETELKPFPQPKKECFYGLAGDFVRLIEPHTEADAMSLLSQFLCYFGNLAGRSAFYKVEGDRHYPNLFCLIVGDTANGRKGTSFGRVKEIFEGIDEDHQRNGLTTGLASGEGLLWHIRDPVERVKSGDKEDAGIADKRLLVVEGEFAQVLKKQGAESSTLSTTIRNLWDSGTTRSLTKNSPLRTTNAHVSIVGHITRTELLNILNEVDSANGYANRFLYFCARRSKFLPFGSEVPKAEIGRIQNRISAAIRFAQTKGSVNFSRAAAQSWMSNYERLETSRTGYLAKVTQRASPYVLRLSLIFALLDESPLIEIQHLEAAFAVWQYSEDSARYIFGSKLDNPASEKILAAMRESEDKKLSRKQIRELFNNHATKIQIDAALQYLLEAKLAVFTTVKTGGKPKEIWSLCDQSDQSDQRSENECVSDKISLPVRGGECGKCNKTLDKDSGGRLFCPLCLEIF